MKTFSMLAAGLFTLSALAFSPVAAAQFGPERVARPDADELYADRAMKNGWYDDALERYGAACEDKSQQREVWARNCRKLGNIYRRGLGIDQDYARAKAIYDEACFDGRDADSCLEQAHVSFKGNDDNQDYEYARRLYKRACDLGDQTGCAAYGSMLYRGQGGMMERDKGKDYIQRACEIGDSWACDRAQGFGFPNRRGL
ncbi:tetratricopeptide repeat protein [Henriciella marina]|uniref:tetratricopeptide repeat protein n=1 Tax=Henriciella marina TaxID=453851 RepID=UPI00037B21F8|nr:tetratricopeptide repeat protein [Henriciella marina]